MCQSHVKNSFWLQVKQNKGLSLETQTGFPGHECWQDPEGCVGSSSFSLSWTLGAVCKVLGNSEFLVLTPEKPGCPPLTVTTKHPPTYLPHISKLSLGTQRRPGWRVTAGHGGKGWVEQLCRLHNPNNFSPISGVSAEPSPKLWKPQSPLPTPGKEKKPRVKQRDSWSRILNDNPPTHTFKQHKNKVFKVCTN